MRRKAIMRCHKVSRKKKTWRKCRQNARSLPWKNHIRAGWSVMVFTISKTRVPPNMSWNTPAQMSCKCVAQARDSIRETVTQSLYPLNQIYSTSLSAVKEPELPKECTILLIQMIKNWMQINICLPPNIQISTSWQSCKYTMIATGHKPTQESSTTMAKGWLKHCKTQTTDSESPMITVKMQH